MDGLIELFKGLFDLEELLRTGGYAVITAIVFIETGLLIGFFLPGDSLLLTAGVLAASGLFDVWILMPLLIVAAVAGDTLGYWIGAKTGPALFNREDSRFFSKKNILAAQEFYTKHGGKTVVIARFVPIVRTFAPVVAGAAQMKYNQFLLYNVMGAVVWVVSMVLGGYLLGNLIPDLEKNLHYGIFAAIVLSLGVPAAFEFIKGRMKKSEAE